MELMDLIVTWFDQTTKYGRLNVERIGSGTIVVSQTEDILPDHYLESTAMFRRYLVSMSDYINYVKVWNGGNQPRLDAQLDFKEPNFITKLESVVDQCYQIALADRRSLDVRK